MTIERNLLQDALIEIKSLRHQLEIRNARLDMFDAVMSALHGEPARQRNGYSHPDIAW